ncbi:G patch domain-containing protein 2-like isoform X1 [Denticeps clupeoides]|uniref:G patch domain-containing protein 2-like n=1 Tax=Denticeps clupeoides TaxID=299321 RepID=A0AAY4C3U2_9TELE|nr:G patch domain-containing protein 2-like isoform X1 [Denticeps clupeoides]
MEELVQDLVSALDQTSEQANLEELWREMMLSPLQQRRQVRRRRGRKRRCGSAPHAAEHVRPCLSEASESSPDEPAGRDGYRRRAAFSGTFSDSDDVGVASAARPSFRTRQHSWPESDSFTENAPGRPLRRRRKVKRVTSDAVTVSLRQKLRVSAVQRGDHLHPHHRLLHHHHHQRSSHKQRLSRLKKTSGGWGDAGGAPGVSGTRMLREECWKDRVLRRATEKQEASDENMSECETSSVCSSDPGLFTNDEGRQGDDEQSDWFVEGECGPAVGLQNLLPGRDPDAPPRPDGPDREKQRLPTFLQPARPGPRVRIRDAKTAAAADCGTLRHVTGCHARLNRLPGVAARCIRKGRRRLPGKDTGAAVPADRTRRFQDSYQKTCWLPPVGKRGRSQFSPLCPLAVYPVDVVPDGSCRRCSSSACRSRLTNAGLLSTGEVKRRRKTAAGPVPAPAAVAFRREERGEEADGDCPGVEPAGSGAPRPGPGLLGPGESEGV